MGKTNLGTLKGFYRVYEAMRQKKMSQGCDSRQDHRSDGMEPFQGSNRLPDTPHRVRFSTLCFGVYPLWGNDAARLTIG